MKILITGINGFAGSILHSELYNRGHDVFGIDTTGNNENIFPADISNFERVNILIKKIEPDFVFHLAAISRVDLNNPALIYDVNFTGTLNILTSISNFQKKPGFIFISSSQVYGTAEHSEASITEDFPVKPVNHYGASKAASENITFAFNKQYAIPVTILRPFNHTGKGQALNFVLPKIVNAFREKKSELELGDIDIVRDFLDVRDVIDAYIRVMEDFVDGAIYNISSGNGFFLPDSIKMLEDMSGIKIEIKQNKTFFRKNDLKHIVGNSSKLRKHLNWTPKYSLKETLNWMLNS